MWAAIGFRWRWNEELELVFGFRLFRSIPTPLHNSSAQSAYSDVLPSRFP